MDLELPTIEAPYTPAQAAAIAPTPKPAIKAALVAHIRGLP